MMEADPIPVGTLLRRHREQRGLTQAELAERLGALSANTISNIERGRTRPYRHTLEALCAAFDLDASGHADMHAAWRRSGGAVRPAAGSTPSSTPPHSTNLMQGGEAAHDGRCDGIVDVAAERTAMEAYDRRGVEGRIRVLKRDDG